MVFPKFWRVQSINPKGVQEKKAKFQKGGGVALVDSEGMGWNILKFPAAY